MINLIILIILIAMYVVYYYISKKYSNKKYYILGIFIYVFLIIYNLMISNWTINMNIPRISILLVLHLLLFERVFDKVTSMKKIANIFTVLILAILLNFMFSLLPEMYIVKFSNPVKLFKYAYTGNEEIINTIYNGNDGAFIVTRDNLAYLKKVKDKWVFEKTNYMNNRTLEINQIPHCSLRVYFTSNNTKLIEITTFDKDKNIEDSVDSKFEQVEYNSSIKYYTIVSDKISDYAVIIDNKKYEIIRNNDFNYNYNKS